MPVQGAHLKDVEALMAEAAEVETAFHTATERLITEAGGVFKQGPLKKEARVREKMENVVVTSSVTLGSLLLIGHVLRSD